MFCSAGIGDAGVAATCGVLAGRVPLRLLDLSRCGLTARAAFHLRSALGVSSAVVQSHQGSQVSAVAHSAAGRACCLCAPPGGMPVTSLTCVDPAPSCWWALLTLAWLLACLATRCHMSLQ